MSGIDRQMLWVNVIAALFLWPIFGVMFTGVALGEVPWPYLTVVGLVCVVPLTGIASAVRERIS